MAKANNPRLQAQVSQELKEITDGMLKHLGMSQAQFFERYLPTLFISLDQEKYFELVKTVYKDDLLEDELNKQI